MTLFQAIVYGIVQGLGEFLPISSSAHLTVLPWLLHWRDPGLAFDVALHVGTLISLLVYFWRELFGLGRALFATVTERRIGPDPQRRLVWYVLFASLPGGAIGYLLEKRAEESFRDPRLIATAMLLMGLLLYLVDRFCAQRRPLDQMTAPSALLIGLAQGLAVIPGVSRSGSTITAGRSATFDRDAAARFSFLLAVPIVAGAALKKVPHLLHEPGSKLPLLLGVTTAAIAGYLAIDLLLRWVRTRSYFPFVVYRVVFAAVVLAIYYTRGAS